MSSNAYSSHTGEYDRIKAIATKYYFSPELPLSEFLSDVSIPNPERVITSLAKQGIISFKDLFQLPRTRWGELRLDKASLTALRTKIVYVRHFNRFEQQSKKFYNFVLSPSTLFLLLMVMLGSMFVVPLLNLGSSEKASLNVTIDYKDMVEDTEATNLEGFKMLTHTVTVSSQVQMPVMVYYVIDGMYQNYRTYTYNMAQRQLSGIWDSTDGCNNYDTVEVDDPTATATGGKKKLTLYACGQVSGAYFNDGIKIEMKDGLSVDRIDRDAAVNVEDVAYVRDFRQKDEDAKAPGHYKVPGFSDSTSFKMERAGKAPNSKEKVSLEDISSSLFLNWAKSSVTPYVYRLYGAIHSIKIGDASNQGNVELIIRVEDRFDAGSFAADKKIVLRSGTELVRGRFFLNIVHFVVGVITLIVMTLMPCFESYLKKKKGRRGRMFTE